MPVQKCMEKRQLTAVVSEVSKMTQSGYCRGSCDHQVECASSGTAIVEQDLNI